MNFENHSLLKLWKRFTHIPMGKHIFSFMIRFWVPYSASTKAQILELEPGYAKVLLSDHRAVRNHLDCIHAIALSNVGELCSGVAVLATLPEHLRAIVVKVNTEYFKKARGFIHAEAHVKIPNVKAEKDVKMTTILTDNSGDEVAKTVVTWRLAPIVANA
ncbi:MAG: DUF4442 domain-containing protein [Gammaproteobacteria bacterium]|nr:DUF4442 domain-containing protein [Gammaproteobacteria bacterium]MDH5729943.1 DUF4442 domain-containing protein [Gammaproteobacteria bacterium]